MQDEKHQKRVQNQRNVKQNIKSTRSERGDKQEMTKTKIGRQKEKVA